MDRRPTVTVSIRTPLDRRRATSSGLVRQRYAVQLQTSDRNVVTDSRQTDTDSCVRNA